MAYPLLHRIRFDGTVLFMTERIVPRDEFLEANQPILNRLASKIEGFAMNHASHYTHITYLNNEPIISGVGASSDILHTFTEEGDEEMLQSWTRTQEAAATMQAITLISALSMRRLSTLDATGKLDGTEKTEDLMIYPEHVEVYRSQFSLDEIDYDVSSTVADGFSGVEGNVSSVKLELTDGTLRRSVSIDRENGKVVGIHSREAPADDHINYLQLDAITIDSDDCFYRNP